MKKGYKYIQQDGVIILAGQSETSGTVIYDPKNMWGVGYVSDDWNPDAFNLYEEDLDKSFSINFSIWCAKNYILEFITNTEVVWKDKLSGRTYTPEQLYYKFNK